MAPSAARATIEGMPLDTTKIDDVAHLAGVSIKTVSRVLNREPRVRDSTRERVEAAIHELGYRPNSSARRLAGKRTYLLGLVYNANSSYSSGVQNGALAACRERHYDLLIHPCHYNDPGLPGELRELVASRRVDGLLLTPPMSDREAVLSLLDELGTPWVVLSRASVEDSPWTVCTNDREVTRDLVRHLVGLGHRRIAFIKGHPDHKAMANRHLGYLDGLKEAGLSETLPLKGDNSFESGAELARRALGADPPPTAIVCANDHMAAGVLRAAYELGVAVPAQLSAAGFDDIPLAGQVTPALTTVRQPMERMARAAANLLIHRLQGQPVDSAPRVMASTLVPRASTGPAPD